MYYSLTKKRNCIECIHAVLFKFTFICSLGDKSNPKLYKTVEGLFHKVSNFLIFQVWSVNLIKTLIKVIVVRAIKLSAKLN